jgi:predicted amidohydrolase
MQIALAQIAPVWMDRERTIEKVVTWIENAAAQQARLVVFGEALLPGYPFWLERTGGARFNDPVQKAFHQRYLEQAVDIEAGDLASVQQAARDGKIAIYLGIVERPVDRGGHSLYCSLVYIDAEGEIGSVHRKLQPTYDERLAWSPGDGHGLRTHALGPFTVGGLNCWENWMPLSRAALYGGGEDLHVAVWPGSRRNTEDITPFLAKEGRSYAVSVSGLMRPEDVSDDFPEREAILGDGKTLFADGGSCVAAPDGSWVLEPETGVESLRMATLDRGLVLRERQNFDPAGHYSRPDVTRLIVNRRRQSITTFRDDD